MRPSHPIGFAIASLVFGVFSWNSGCSSNSGNSPTGDDGGGAAASGSGGGGSGVGGIIMIDSGTNCQQGAGGACIANCPSGQDTTISGTVYDPAGKNLLPYVAVYIPAVLPLPKLPKGADCNGCVELFPKAVLAGSLTGDGSMGPTGLGPMGQFKITGAPAGAVTLVVQAGKWRMSYSVTVKGCQDNPIMQTLRLPRNGGEGDLPDIAISTGGADSLECLLKRIGVDDSEYTDGDTGSGHIHIFQGGQGNNVGPAIDGATPVSYQNLWTTATHLQTYDVVLLSCEGGETTGAVPTALETYANLGGRAFLSHFHYKWFTAGGSPFATGTYNLVTNWQAGTNDTGNIVSTVNTSFPKGQTMHDWLKLVGALDMNDHLAIQASRQNIVGMSNTPPTTDWIDSASPPGDSRAMADWTQYFSFDMPINASKEKTCGRIVYSDLHVGAASGDYGGAVTTTGGVCPTQCKAGPLSPQEAALEFMLFDLSSCLTPTSMRPMFPNIAK